MKSYQVGLGLDFLQDRGHRLILSSVKTRTGDEPPLHLWRVGIFKVRHTPQRSLLCTS